MDHNLIKTISGTSLAVQWLRLHLSNSGGTGLILVGEIKIHILHSTAQRQKRPLRNCFQLAPCLQISSAEAHRPPEPWAPCSGHPSDIHAGTARAPGHTPHPGVSRRPPCSPKLGVERRSPTLQADSLLSEPQGKPAVERGFPDVQWPVCACVHVCVRACICASVCLCVLVPQALLPPAALSLNVRIDCSP